MKGIIRAICRWSCDAVWIGRSDVRRFGFGSAAALSPGAGGETFDRLLAGRRRREVVDRRVLGHVTELGYTDLVGQLHWRCRSSRRAVGAVCGRCRAGGGLHPADRPAGLFVSEEDRRRMELTWVTFPTVVLAFSGGAYCWPIGSKGTSCGSIRSIWSIWMPSRAWCGGRVGRPCTVPQIDTFDLALRTDPSDSPRQAAAGAVVVDGAAGRRGVGREPGGRIGTFTSPIDFRRPWTRSSICRSRCGRPVRCWPLVGRGTVAAGCPFDRPRRSRSLGGHARR